MVEAIAIFDIGKTNKKVLLFDRNLKVVFEQENKFPETKDEEGFECDDASEIKGWIIETLREFGNHSQYRVKAVNFATYGATLMYLDESGNSLTPPYNYLKPMPEEIASDLYDRFGGVDEFSRQTASPALGFLNSGLQILWLKKTKPEVFSRVKSILHFPQYFSHLLTGKILSDYTSIGCHTAMWDFDNMAYHPWLEEEGIRLPGPVSNMTLFASNKNETEILAGTGIHDSSASLAPYIMQSREKFILLSTGTWCINMNPFNYEPLTPGQLKNDCLSYLSINKKPVKSSRLFMGHIHDVNLENINSHFNTGSEEYKKVAPKPEVLKRLLNGSNSFFKGGVPEDYIDRKVDLAGFANFEEAYHRLMMDLTSLCVQSINYILPENDDIKTVFISGGFAKNELFLRLLADKLGNKRVFTSVVDNATALGAAMVVYEEAMKCPAPEIDLGLKEWGKL